MLAQYLTTSFVNRCRGRPGSNLSNRSPLSFEHSLIHLPRTSAWMTHVHGAGPVRAITGEYNTEVADHESAARDPGFGSPAMHDRRPLASSDDGRKRHALSARSSRLVFHGSGNFHFFDTRANLLARDLE